MEDIKIIKNFEKIIEENKYNMFQLMILYNMTCHDNYVKLNFKQKKQLLDFLYELYLKDESKTDLGYFSDYVMSNYRKILAGKISRDDILYNIDII